MLHAITIEVIQAGARTGQTWEPSKSREDRALLLDNAQIAWAILTSHGFEKTCAVIAGLDSGSTWIHPETLERAEVMVRKWNIPVVTSRAEQA
ncbi:MAG: hypothetical protein AB7R40_23295 [Nitrospiraceae bacterium]